VKLREYAASVHHTIQRLVEAEAGLLKREQITPRAPSEVKAAP
jgi:hypothetical protein